MKYLAFFILIYAAIALSQCGIADSCRGASAHCQEESL